MSFFFFAPSIPSHVNPFDTKCRRWREWIKELPLHGGDEWCSSSRVASFSSSFLSFLFIYAHFPPPLALVSNWKEICFLCIFLPLSPPPRSLPLPLRLQAVLKALDFSLPIFTFQDFLGVPPLIVLNFFFFFFLTRVDYFVRHLAWRKSFSVWRHLKHNVDIFWRGNKTERLFLCWLLENQLNIVVVLPIWYRKIIFQKFERINIWFLYDFLLPPPPPAICVI